MLNEIVKLEFDFRVYNHPPTHVIIMYGSSQVALHVNFIYMQQIDVNTRVSQNHKSEKFMGERECM